LKVSRNRGRYALLILITIALGLATRPLKLVAESLGSALGDALWAIMVYLMLCAAFPKLAAWRIFVAALLISYIVEASQLSHNVILVAIRNNPLGGLAIGGSFSLTDLACYTVGAGLVFWLDKNRNRN
jgi:hypothetical protein